tara:strand:+ start:9084 stop:9425 length:342 start_codon:yes stop_codon:yes gene_type:complete
MASYTTAQLSADLDFANLDCQVTLVTVLPTSSVGVEFTASKQELTQRFMVEMNGREEMVDQKFYINQDGLSTVPSKGWVLSTGGRSYKVWETDVGAAGVLLKLSCVSQYQSTT